MQQRLMLDLEMFQADLNDRLPEANLIWLFGERLTQANGLKQLFTLSEATLWEREYLL